MEIPGNKAADKAAKSAAARGMDGVATHLGTGDLPALDQPLPGLVPGMPPGVYHPQTCCLTAAIKVKIQKEAKVQWERQ